jgi:NAD(P)-dependent dehydrogenase (short-subunit alcohol dehydrogenase family)
MTEKYSMKSLNLAKTPSFRLDGRRALVTGAGRGIGLGIATAFAESGAEVTLCARTADEIEQVATSLRDAGWRANALVLDVTEVSSFRRAIDLAEPFDILANNAGTNRPKPFIDVPEEDFNAVMDLNVRAAYFAAQAVARRLIDAGRPGSIINVSSQMGHVGAPNRSLYCASKWAMEGFSRAMAIELGPHGIRVNTLCPTFVETPMTRSFLQDPTFRSSVVNRIKLGRVGTIEDLMGAAVFLASDAAALMTGTSLIVDGGWTAD